MKKKVLITASTFPAFKGDTCPRFILDHCKGIVSTEELDCMVLVPHSKGAKTKEILEGIRVKRYKYFYPEYFQKISGNGITSFIKKNPLYFLVVPFFIFFQFISTLITVMKYKPDVIIANWIFPQGFIAALVKKIFPELKLITVCLGGDAALINSNFSVRKLSDFVVKNSDKTIVVSSFLKKILLKNLKNASDNIVFIPMAVDESLFIPKDQTYKKDKSILFIGRLVEKKGVKYIINSMTEVLNKYPDAFLHIVGDGILKNELIKQTEKLSIKQNIIFHGAIEQLKLPEFFNESLIFVAPSVNNKDDIEGLPTVLTEAIASKVPVITTNAGGITDLIENYKTGIIVDQKNSTQLAEKIIELIENKNLRNNLTENAYNKLINDFTLTKTTVKYREIIFETLN